MTGIFNFIFDNFILFIIVAAGIYLFKEYKEIKSRIDTIGEIFEKGLHTYLDAKITDIKAKADSILIEYESNEIIVSEINRLLIVIEKGINGSINDKVATSNSLNKYKINKKIDLEKYPSLKYFNNIETFTEEDLESKENGIAISRREYNAEAFRYNEKATSSTMQIIIKLFHLPSQFNIFDAPKSTRYEDAYEVFEEQEPEINSLAVLNRSATPELDENSDDSADNKEEISIEHSDLILKPSTELKEKKD